MHSLPSQQSGTPNHCTTTHSLDHLSLTLLPSQLQADHQQDQAVTWQGTTVNVYNVNSATTFPLQSPLPTPSPLTRLPESNTPQQLTPLPEAPRALLIRRLYLDLLGLPPTEAERASLHEEAALLRRERSNLNGVFTSLGFQLAVVQNTWTILILWTLGGGMALIGALVYASRIYGMLRVTAGITSGFIVSTRN